MISPATTLGWNPETKLPKRLAGANMLLSGYRIGGWAHAGRAERGSAMVSGEFRTPANFGRTRNGGLRGGEQVGRGGDWLRPPGRKPGTSGFLGRKC